MFQLSYLTQQSNKTQRVGRFSPITEIGKLRPGKETTEVAVFLPELHPIDHRIPTVQRSAKFSIKSQMVNI